MTARLPLNFLRGVAVAAGMLFAAGPADAQIPNTLLHTIPAPNRVPQGGARFGAAVAVDGDYAAAGAPSDNTGDHYAGIVKVYRAGALLYTLTNPNPEYASDFGTALALSGTRLVVGAPGSRKVYVYDLAGATPTVPVHVLPNPAPQLSASFGGAVAVSGTRVVVGANTSGEIPGNAYVFDLASATPSVPVVTLNTPAPAGRSDYYGTSVAISGSRVVVGAPFR